MPALSAKQRRAPIQHAPTSAPGLHAHWSRGWLRAVMIDRISRRNDLWVASNAAEREAIQRLRYSIYGCEQGDQGGHVDHVRGTFVVAGDAASHVTLIGCGPRTAPVATVRIETWEPEQVPADYARKHGLHRFPDSSKLRVSHVSHLMVSPELRGALSSAGFIIGAMALAARIARPDITLAHAAPGLLHHYHCIGFRPTGAPVFSSTRGLEIPLAFLPDRGWLVRQGCISGPALLRLVDRKLLPAPSLEMVAALAVESPVLPPRDLERLWERCPSIPLQSLGARVRREVLRRAVAIEVPAYTDTIVEGFTGEDLQIVMSGAVDQRRDGQSVGCRTAGVVLGSERWLGRTHAQPLTTHTTQPTILLNIRGKSLKALCNRSEPMRRQIRTWLERATP